MFNISYKGDFISENQLVKRKLEGAILIKGGENTEKEFNAGIKRSMTWLIIIFFFIQKGIRMKITNSDEIELLSLIAMAAIVAILFLISIPLHEVLHAIGFPLKCEKEMWKDTDKGIMFLYCTASVKKGKYILLTLLPSIILGVVPLVVSLIIYNKASAEIVVGLMIYSFGNICAGTTDYGIASRIFSQVPKNGIVFNSGVETYWKVEE